MQKEDEVRKKETSVIISAYICDMHVAMTRTSTKYGYWYAKKKSV